MTTKPESAPDPAVLSELVEKCSRLCTQAEKAIGRLGTERKSFLSQNLEGALQQLELILRVLDDKKEAPRDDERRSFLHRLFARSNDKEGETPQPEEDIQPPNFDVSSQGLQGNSWTVSLPELLGFLSFAHKTGVLWVDSPNENFLVGIEDGQLMHVSSDHTPEGLRLGEVLVGMGYLTRRQLERFLDNNGNPAATSGEALLESGMICDDELREALNYQITKLFTRLIRTQQAIFRFQESLTVQLAYQVRMDINQLLLDTARQSDEGENSVHVAAAVMQDWNNWRTELGSVMGDMKSESATESTTDSATPKKAPTKQDPTKAATDTPDSKKSEKPAKKPNASQTPPPPSKDTKAEKVKEPAKGKEADKAKTPSAPSPVPAKK